MRLNPALPHLICVAMSTAGQSTPATARRTVLRHCTSCHKPPPRVTLSRAPPAMKGTMLRGARRCMAAGVAGPRLIVGLGMAMASSGMTAETACCHRMRIWHSWCQIEPPKAASSRLLRSRLSQVGTFALSANARLVLAHHALQGKLQFLFTV